MAVLKWILVMTVLLIIGTYLIRESYEQVQDTPLSWVDCWCAVLNLIAFDA